jgi:hypothetical protein
VREEGNHWRGASSFNVRKVLAVTRRAEREPRRTYRMCKSGGLLRLDMCDTCCKTIDLPITAIMSALRCDGQSNIDEPRT